MSKVPPQPVVLFDWGETLMWVPGMIHDPQRHLACVESVFESDIRPELGAGGALLPLAIFIEYYHEACRTQIARSKESLREHSFDERFALTLQLAGMKAIPDAQALRRMSDALGREVTKETRLLDFAGEVVDWIFLWVHQFQPISCSSMSSTTIAAT